MRSSTKTRDRDRGFKRIVNDLKRGAKSRVFIGWFEEFEHEAEEGTVPTALIAGVHEFGSPKRGIPRRPMLAFVADRHGDRYRKMAKQLWQEVLAGEHPVEGALEILGTRIEADVKQRITDGPFAPLSERTIAQKGSSQPLIDTGAMRAQASHRVFLRK